MMKTIITSVLFLIASLSNVSAQDQAQLDTSKSKLYWMGSSFMGFNNHYGSVEFKKGHLTLADDKINGGTFLVDMGSITNLDGDGYNKGLVEHLKNEDFFFSFRYHTAQLNITNITYQNKTEITVEADLIIKDVKKPITFTALLDYEKKEFLANFSIDRTRWNILHATRFETSVKDNMLSDSIEFKAHLVFK